MIVYKSYDQEALNLQYNNRAQVPEHPLIIKMWEDESRRIEQLIKGIKDISYGEAPREKLDIYPSAFPLSKTLVFIHGGYWRNLDKSYFQFIAKAFREYNLTIVIITYPLAPESSIGQIVYSCRKATQWVFDNITQYNGDPGQVYLVGHSAGGHLASMMMTGNKDVRSFPLKGVLSMSGLFNLTPIRLSEINQTLQMDSKIADENSPVLLAPNIDCPLVLTVGGTETAEYKAQSEELYSHWKDYLPVKLIELEGLNHFSIVGDVLDKTSVLHKEIIAVLDINK